MAQKTTQGECRQMEIAITIICEDEGSFNMEGHKYYSKDGIQLYDRHGEYMKTITIVVGKYCETSLVVVEDVDSWEK